MPDQARWVLTRSAHRLGQHWSHRPRSTSPRDGSTPSNRAVSDLLRVHATSWSSGPRLSEDRRRPRRRWSKRSMQVWPRSYEDRTLRPTSMTSIADVSTTSWKRRRRVQPSRAQGSGTSLRGAPSSWQDAARPSSKRQFEVVIDREGTHLKFSSAARGHAGKRNSSSRRRRRSDWSRCSRSIRCNEGALRSVSRASTAQLQKWERAHRGTYERHVQADSPDRAEKIRILQGAIGQVVRRPTSDDVGSRRRQRTSNVLLDIDEDDIGGTRCVDPAIYDKRGD